MLEGNVAPDTKMKYRGSTEHRAVQDGAQDELAGADVISSLVTERTMEPLPDEALTIDIATSGGFYDHLEHSSSLAADYGGSEDSLDPSPVHRNKHNMVHG